MAIISFFTLKLDEDRVLDKGRFFLIEVGEKPEDTKIIGRWVATSGKPELQSASRRGNVRYGPIPSCYDTTNVKTCYKLFTAPLDRSGTPGIEGPAFLITPDPKMANGVVRTELMLHEDIGLNSTLGCIGIMESYSDLVEKLTKISKSFSWIPLIVGHTY